MPTLKYWDSTLGQYVPLLGGSGMRWVPFAGPVEHNYLKGDVTQAGPWTTVATADTIDYPVPYDEGPPVNLLGLWQPTDQFDSISFYVDNQWTVSTIGHIEYFGCIVMPQNIGLEHICAISVNYISPASFTFTPTRAGDWWFSVGEYLQLAVGDMVMVTMSVALGSAANAYWQEDAGYWSTLPQHCSAARGAFDGGTHTDTAYGVMVQFTPGEKSPNWDVIAYNGEPPGGDSGGGGSGLDESTADALYVNVTGDLMTGDLELDYPASLSFQNTGVPVEEARVYIDDGNFRIDSGAAIYLDPAAGWPVGIGGNLNIEGNAAITGGTGWANGITVNNAPINSTGRTLRFGPNAAPTPNFSNVHDLVAIGYQALQSLTTGDENVAVGVDALNGVTSGWDNTAVGYQAGYGAVTQYSTYIGAYAGTQDASGYENVAIGMSSGPQGSSISGAVTIGEDSYTTKSYAVVVGGDAFSEGLNGIALGNATGNYADGGIAIGAGSYVNSSATDSVAIGRAVSVSVANTIVLGKNTHTVSIPGTLSLGLVDAKGDLLVGTADNTIGRLPVGTNNYVLTADSTQASGMKWAAGGGGLDQATADTLYVNITGDTMTSALTIKPANAAAYFYLDAVAGYDRSIWGLRNSSPRWRINAGNSAAESSTATGSNFAISSYDNSGTLWDFPLSIDRQTSQVEVSVDPATNMGVATKQYVDNQTSNVVTPLDYSFNLTTTPPPGAGQLRLNNASQPAATTMYVHYDTAPGADVKLIWTKTVVTGDTIILQDKDDSSKWQRYTVSATPTDNTTYCTITVSWVDGGTALTAARTLVFLKSPGGLSQTTADTRYVNIDGDTMTGMLTLFAAPSNDLHAATKKYADDKTTTHEAAADPHTGYQLESEKAAVNGYASLDGTTKVPIAQVPTGTTSTTVSLGNHNHDTEYVSKTTSDTMAGQLTLNSGGLDLLLKPGSADHAFIGLYARTASPTTRTAYIGFGAAASDQFTIKNEITDADIRFSLTGTAGNIMLPKDPTANFAAATKQYVDAVKSGSWGWVNHGSTAGTARPTGYGAIQWIGTVAPTNAATGDVWVDAT